MAIVSARLAIGVKRRPFAPTKDDDADEPKTQEQREDALVDTVTLITRVWEDDVENDRTVRLKRDD